MKCNVCNEEIPDENINSVIEKHHEYLPGEVIDVSYSCPNCGHFEDL